jgi:hypothetical protein
MKSSLYRSLGVSVAAAAVAIFAVPVAAQDGLFLPTAGPYDLVISGGRVLDPESERDEVMNIGVRNGVIATLSIEDLEGRREIDATGRLVVPGFIDLHTHTPFPYGELFQVKDGVTTALDLEAGAFPVAAYGEFIREGARANYGSSVAHYAIRIKVIEGKDQPYLVTGSGMIVPGAAFQQVTTPEQIEDSRFECIEQVHA